MSDPPRRDPPPPGGDDSRPHPSLAAELSATAHRVEHLVEERVEHGIELAEQTIVRRFGLGALRAIRTTLRFAFRALVVAWFAFGTLLLVTRHYLLPRIDQWRPQIESIVSGALQGTVTVGRIEGGWRGFNPHLALGEVLVTGPHGGVPLALPRVDATLSWTSLFSLEPRFVALRLQSPELSIVRLPDGRFTVAGFVIQPGRADAADAPALDWLLAQKRIVVRNGQVRYRDERGTEPVAVDLERVDLIVEQRLASHTFGLQAVPTAAFAGPIDLRATVTTSPFQRKSDIGHWNGQAFAQLESVDLAQLARVLPLPVQVDRAHGALRLWLAFDDGEILRSTADVALRDVTTRLAGDLEPLQLSSLRGRLAQRRWGDVWPVGRGGQEFGLVGTTFSTVDGLTFPPMDVRVRRTRAAGGAPEHTSIEASHVDLESLAAVVPHLPLPQDLERQVGRYRLRGKLSGLAVAWSGESPAAAEMALRARFTGLSSAAQPAAADDPHTPGVPGFENLSGAVRMDKGAGTLELASADAALVFPGVFEEPRLPVKQLTGTVHWKQGAALEVRTENLRVANDDADVTANGTYRAAATGPGTVDLSGRIARAHAAAAYRYIPLVAGDGTRRWLQHALVGGRLGEGTFRLRGDLRRFPFMEPAEGDFRIAGRVTDATLDVYPAEMEDAGRPAEPGTIWPVLAGIDADLVFERASMTIHAQRGRAYGARIEQATARIPHLGHDATLDVKGVTSGPLADLVRYANASPVNGWIGGVTTGADAKGSARLDLRLVIPLGHPSDAKVEGAIAFQNNSVTLTDIPPFTRTSGTLHFHERGVRISNLTATLLGGPARLDATTRTDGTLVFNVAGSATPAGLRGVVPVTTVQRLIDRASGNARYQATVLVKDGTELRIDSDLVGLALDGVAPLRKASGEALPLRIVRRSTAGGDDLDVQAGHALGIRIERRRADDSSEPRLVRGVVALNEAPRLPERGLLVLAAVPRLDVDAWSELLAPDAPPSRAPARVTPADEDLRVDLVALRTDELLVAGHRVEHLTLGATRRDDGSYVANIASDGATGFIEWRPDRDPQALGHITARLSRLVITARKEHEVVEVLRAPPKQIPSLEIGVEEFELSGMKLGRLDLVAQNVGSGAGGVWRVRRLDIANPDMKLAATGEWGPAPAGGRRRAQLEFALDAVDAGATLARIGFPGALARGAGRVAGTVDWLGSPLDIDYPTLAGKVSLTLDNGRFLKVDTGNAARLLALLSLQSLGRNLAADGGVQFTEGFAFTSLRADASIDRGILTTDNFRMNGASAAVLMSGTLDLGNETQQLSVIVLPEIDASTAALAVGVVNPVLGLGTFLAQLVLKDPLSKAFALQYDVTGSWTDPKITRRTRINPSRTSEAPK